MTYHPFRHIGSAIYKHKPIQFTFFLTGRCNARCSFCFYLSNNAPCKDLSELTTEEIKKISASMGRLLWLAFSGGEIFLRDDLAEITKLFYKNNKPAIILLPTNGLLPDVIYEATEAIVRGCEKSTVAVKLSLDGDEELHDSLRGVKGAFQKTMETYEKLGGLLDKYPNFELGINSVFCSANQNQMDKLIAFVNGLKRVTTHTVSFIRGDVSDESLKDIDIGKYYETISLMDSNLKKRLSGVYRFKGARLKAAQDILQRRLIHETLIKQKRLIPCYAGRLTLVLTETGDLYPCESFKDRIGNVREAGYDIKRLLQTEKSREILGGIKSKGCYCTHECYLMMNILFNPKMYPSLLKEYLQL